MKGIWGNRAVDVKDEAIYKRMNGDTWKIAKEIFFEMSKKMAEIGEKVKINLAQFAKNIYVIDDTTLDKVAKKTGWLKMEKGYHLAGRISSMYDIRKGQFVAVDITEESTRNEKIMAWEFLKDIEAGSLLLFDLGYFGFKWFDELTERKISYISRLRENTSYEKLHVFYEHDIVTDSMIKLGKYRSDHAKHAVRLIEVRYKGDVYRYITNVYDPRQLSARDIVNLYGRRWDIELAFKLVKRVLGLAGIWSAHKEVIKLQVYATLTIAQIVQALRHELALRANEPVDNVSEALLVRVIYLFGEYDDEDILGKILKAPDYGGVIRPSRRKKYEIGEIPENSIKQLPDDFEFVRNPRYAERKCVHRGI
jgi:hypothetical protein